MTQRVSVLELRPGASVYQNTFMVSDFKVMTTKAGKAYASFSVNDQTGTMKAVWWEYGQAPEAFAKQMLDGALLDFSGEVLDYKGTSQFKVLGVSPATVTDMHFFEKRTKYDFDELSQTFKKFLHSFEDQKIQRLAEAIFDDYAEHFCAKPAATGMHHAFKHGLLEHTTEMLQTADTLLSLPFYGKNLNRDYCMFGIMFHDFMKVFEYGDGPGFKRTTLGIMVPHIPKMAGLIEAYGGDHGLTEQMITYLQAIVLSHHKRLEWGSPCKPSTPEALFVHHVDNLHGDVFGVLQRIEADSTSEEFVKHGFGDDMLTIVKKRFDKVLEEENLSYDEIRNLDKTPREESSLGGF